MYINWILALIVIGYLLQSGLLDPGFKYINDTYHIDLKAQITALLAKFNILKKPDFLTVLEDQNVHIEDNLYELCHGSLYLAKMLAKDNNFHLYNEVYDLLSGKLDLQEKTKLIHKLADEKLWNLTGNLIELIIFKIAKEHK